MRHTFPCGCPLCGSFVTFAIDGASELGSFFPTITELASLLSDIGTLTRLDPVLEKRVRDMLARMAKP